PGDPLGRRRNGPAPLAAVAVPGRALGTTAHRRRAAPLSASPAAPWPGVRLGRGGRAAGYRGPGRGLDRVGPPRAGAPTRPAGLHALSAAHRGARARDGRT